MEEELNYLSERLQMVENNIARDLDYGYTGEKIDDQLEEQRLLENIIIKCQTGLKNVKKMNQK